MGPPLFSGSIPKDQLVVVKERLVRRCLLRKDAMFGSGLWESGEGEQCIETFEDVLGMRNRTGSRTLLT